MTKITLSLCAAFALVACGGGDGNKTIDAPTTPVDSAGGGDAAVGITCGTMTCMETQECCVGANTSTCVAMGTCTTVAFQCDGPEDCETNNVCCFAAGGGGPGTAGAECTPASNCQTTACHLDTDCGGNTPKCCPIPMAGYSLCRAAC